MYNLFQAGIKRRNLELAFEPEVAAVHCMHIPSENLSGIRKDLKEMSEPGRKFAVLDLGGNVVFIHVYSWLNRDESSSERF